MTLGNTRRPDWLTFDCYGTLIQWDEGLQAVASRVMKMFGDGASSQAIVQAYDRHESDLEESEPFTPFRYIAPVAFKAALGELGVAATEANGEALLDAIPSFGPFPEALGTLAALKASAFKIAIISNTDDDLIAGNVAQLGGHIDKVVTAEQARAYKPSRRIFAHALDALDTSYDRMLHICASPGLDHAAARDQGFRCIWIDRGTYRKQLHDYTPDETFETLTGVVELFARLGWLRS